MRIWYFFIACVFLLVAIASLFASFLLWNTARFNPNYPKRPKRVAAFLVAGVVSAGLWVFFLLL